MQEAIRITEELQFLDASQIHIERNAFEELVVKLPDGTSHTDVEPVLTFPLTEANRYISLLDSEANELGMIQDIKHLPKDSQSILTTELRRRYFMPKITKIHFLEGEFGVTKWIVETNRGEVEFGLKTRYDVVTLESGQVLIKDADGNRYEIENYHRLDPKSLALLETQI